MKQILYKMNFSFKNIKLKEILFLQDFAQNPQSFAFLGVKGHIGIDVNFGHLDPVYSFTNGEVIYVSAFGDVVIIDDKLEYTYSHLIKMEVKVGQEVKVGDLIGYQDSNGKSVQGGDWTHLHFGIRELGTETPKTWNFGRKIKNVNNGFDGFIDTNLYCQKVVYRVAEAIKKFENMPVEYNNPGALRWSPFQSGTKNNFAVFLTYEDGWKALIHQLTIAANGKSKWYKPTMKVLDFCKLYAPSSDNNNPENYAKFINDYCGFRGKEPISDWLLTELEWVKKYNNVSRGRMIWAGDALIMAFNKLWGLFFRNI